MLHLLDRWLLRCAFHGVDEKEDLNWLLTDFLTAAKELPPE